MSEKYCINCKHYIKMSGSNIHVCIREIKIEEKISLIDGSIYTKQKGNRLSCISERYNKSNGGCDTDGKFFEQKEGDL